MPAENDWEPGGTLVTCRSRIRKVREAELDTGPAENGGVPGGAHVSQRLTLSHTLLVT